MAKPLWDGIAQVDEIISSAALPRDDIKASANLPLSDKTAPFPEQESSTFEASEALGWGDFDMDDTAVRSPSGTCIVARLVLKAVGVCGANMASISLDLMPKTAEMPCVPSLASGLIHGLSPYVN